MYLIFNNEMSSNERKVKTDARLFCTSSFIASVYFLVFVSRPAKDNEAGTKS